MISKYLRKSTPAITDDGSQAAASGRLHFVVNDEFLSESFLVIFNSQRGNFFSCQEPCKGHDVKWDFYKLAFTCGGNFIRIGEDFEHSYWYLDKVEKIYELLATALRQRPYRKIVFCGASSGGYASLLFGELLAEEFTDRTFLTATINPQIVHNGLYKKYLDVLAPAQGCAQLADEGFARRDIEQVNIPEIIGLNEGSRHNIEHHIYYDCGNDFERYQTDAISHMPGFYLQPFTMEKSHSEGIREIYARANFAEKIRSFVGLRYDVPDWEDITEARSQSNA